MGNWGTMFGSNITLVTFLIIAVLTVCFLIVRKFIWKSKPKLNRVPKSAQSAPFTEPSPETAPVTETVELQQGKGNRTVFIPFKQPELEHMKAMVFSKKFGGIVFKNIKADVGNAVSIIEPSMPSSGLHAIGVDMGDGVKPYDNREAPIIRAETPQDCYDATHWDDDVSAVYANTHGIWEHIPQFLIGFIAVLWFIICLVAIDKL